MVVSCQPRTRGNPLRVERKSRFTTRIAKTRSKMDSRLPLLPWDSRKQLAGSLFIRVTIPKHHPGVKLISSKGEQTGPTSALDFCSPGTALPRHLLIPSRAKISLPEEDRNFLLAKGVFSLPGNNACASLLRAYMSHVHPIMPIIEIDQILNHYHDGRLNEYNILLLWSVFFAGVNVRRPPGFSNVCVTKASRQFIPASVYEEEGYNSRKEMKSDLYSRAKVRRPIEGRPCPLCPCRTPN